MREIEAAMPGLTVGLGHRLGTAGDPLLKGTKLMVGEPLIIFDEVQAPKRTPLTLGGLRKTETA